MQRRAFSVVELLVVVGIIAILIAILLPVISRVREQARTTACAANLRQWGVALVAYSQANEGHLMETARVDGSPYPDVFWVYSQPAANGGSVGRNPSQTTALSVQAINRYLPDQVNLQTKEFGKLFLCPSNVNGDPNGFKNNTWGAVTDPNAYFHSQYSYFAHITKWQPANGGAASQPKLLTDTMLAPDRLLMCDFIYYWGQTGRWAYNHGKKGASSYWDGNGILSDPGPPPITGVNKLYGDGRVEWDAGFDPQKMQASATSGGDPTLRWVRDTGNWYTWY